MVSRFNIKVTDTHMVLDYVEEGTYMAYREHAALEAEAARLRDKRWWQAYLAAVTGLACRTDLFGPGHAAGVDTLAREMADLATDTTDAAASACSSVVTVAGAWA